MAISDGKLYEMAGAIQNGIEHLEKAVKDIAAHVHRIEQRITGAYYSPVQKCSICITGETEPGVTMCEACLANLEAGR